jgi:4-alpha-glucanotransferase
MIRGAETAPARYCVIPLQDVLGLGSEARMNVPSRADGNWSWRYQPGALTAEIARRLADLAEVTDRQPSLPAQQGQGETAEEFAA